MKSIALSLFAVLTAFSALASGKWTLQGKEYNVDTLYHAYVGPGTTHTKLKLSGAANLLLFYTTTDMSDRYVDMRVGKVGAKPVLSTLSKMCSTLSTDGAQYLAGVNADFFNFSGERQGMIGAAVIDGGVYHFPAVNHETNMAISPDKEVLFDKFDLNGKITNTSTKLTRAFSIINSTIVENKVMLYSSHYGETTRTPAGTYEVPLVPVDENELPMIGKTVQMKVAADYSTAGSTPIPANGWVLAVKGNDAFTKFVVDAKKDCIMELKMTLTGNSSFLVEQMCSGCPMIARDGVVLNTQGTLDHLPTNQPRTAVGYDVDSKKMVMMVVDGRSGKSAGCTSKVLGDIMIHVGCPDALNFDGGGSSELYMKDFGIVNTPSDGSERAVSDALWVVSVAPDDSEIAQIRFVDYAKVLDKGYRYTPEFYGYNKYGVLVSKNVEGVKLSCPAQLGSVSDDGKTLTASGAGCHALTGTYNGMTCTIPVQIAGTVGAVDAVTADDAELPAEYYDLNGVRVDNPAQGLYIERRGDRASKVILN